MSTHANTLFKEASSIWYDWGTVAALTGAILLFEFAPPNEIGSISTRQSDAEMQAVEADLAFDDTVQEQQEEVQQQQEDMQQAAQDVMQELNTDVTISLSDSTVGLSSVQTVSQTLQDVGAGEEMGPPRFMPVEVFPNCTYRPNPQYPPMARAASVEGTVTLWVYVKVDGTVGDVSVYNSSGADALDEAAVSAAWNTRWVPAQNNGQAVSVWTTMQYVFQLTS
jgi:TonB family protein